MTPLSGISAHSYVIMWSALICLVKKRNPGNCRQNRTLSAAICIQKLIEMLHFTCSYGSYSILRICSSKAWFFRLSIVTVINAFIFSNKKIFSKYGLSKAVNIFCHPCKVFYCKAPKILSKNRAPKTKTWFQMADFQVSVL